MDDIEENLLQSNVAVQVEPSPDFPVTNEMNGGNRRDLELKGLTDKIVRPIKYRNSPIIHRRSRLEELLSIPDVAAALSNSEDDVGSLPVKLRSKEQKLTVRPPSPAYLGPPLPESAGEDTPTEHFSFSFENQDVSPANGTEVDSAGGITRSELTYQDESVERKGTQYDIIADSLGPIESALTTDSQMTMVGHRLSLTSSVHYEEGMVSPEESPLGEDNKIIPENSDENEYVEDYFDTYNRPSIRERRIQEKNRLSKNKDDFQVTALTWKSLARAIARVQSLSSNKETSILKAEPHPIPILKIMDPASRSGLRASKKTVSFSRLPSESMIRNAADCVSMMQMGHQFVKMRSNARIYNRYYWFDLATSSLRWEPSKKDAGKAKIDISAIKEVRPGKATELFLSSEISSHFQEECSFSIIYSDYKNLDLIAGSPDEANIWITGLRCLLGGQDPEEIQSRRDSRDTWLSSVFESADANGDGFLDEEESLALLKSLSDGIRETRIKQKLTEFLRFKDRDRTRLTKDEFVELFKDVTTRPEIYFLLARHASRDDRLSVDDLMLFLESEQGLTDVTKEKCIELIEQFEPSLELKEIPAFGIDGFTKYLMSPECNIFNPVHSQVCQDMSQPLSHYFIASSHNTYLMEDQTRGPSNISAYMRALLRCCRCVELDCWDGPDNKPVIWHGHTESNSISFEQTIEAIKECSFKHSPYPVILCIENHCSIEQQKTMASVLISILGDQIYTTSADEKAEYLPSPEDLKYKFLIRGKKIPVDQDEGDVSDEDEGIDTMDYVALQNASGSFSIGPGLVLSKREAQPERHRKIRLAKELSDLVSLCISIRINDNDFLFPQQKPRRYFEFTSMHERTATNLLNLSPEEFVNFNKKYLTRVYPSSARIDSSNFNPQDFWNCGVQIASLNYQTPGLMMDINDGRFTLNGGCGYVLKPSIMRDEVAYFSAQQHDVIPSITPKILHLRIISGQEFPKPRGGGAKVQTIDPYVLIELFGMPSDCVEKRSHTVYDCGSGNSTALFDQTFEFKLTLPDLALIRFVVLDDEYIGDEFIGQYTIPFECLQPGYRHLRLRSIFDEPLDNATLFVHVAVTEAIPQLSHVLSAPLLQNSLGGPNVQSNTQPSSKKLSKRSSSTSVLSKRSKKAIQQQQARRERAAAMRPVGVTKVDAIFRSASPILRDVGEMRENLHISLSFFKEACGVSSLNSVKQCIRSLTQRVNVESQQGTGKKLIRKISSDSSNPSPSNGLSGQATPKLKEKSGLVKSNSVKGSLESLYLKTDHSGKLSLKMGLDANNCPSLEIYNMAMLPPSSGDVWKKVLTAFNALVGDAKYVIDNISKCQEQLFSIHKQVLTYHEELPALLMQAQNAANEVPPTTVGPGGKKQKKKTSKEKLHKQNPPIAKFSKKSEWDFTWNCSVIKGHLDTLESVQKEAQSVLSHLREAGLSAGLIGEESANSGSSGSLKKSNSKLSNSSDESRDSGRPEKSEDNESMVSDSSSQHSKSEDTDTTHVIASDNKNTNSNNNGNHGRYKQDVDKPSNVNGTDSSSRNPAVRVALEKQNSPSGNTNQSRFGPPSRDGGNASRLKIL